MAVRVKLRLQARLPGPNLGPIDVVGLVNTGYEAGRPELIVPGGLARRLGWWPPPPGAIAENYGTAGGPFQVQRLPAALDVVVVTPDRTGAQVVADAVLAMHETEVLLSDALPGPLGLDLVDATAGSWAFRDERGTLRPSEPRQLW